MRKQYTHIVPCVFTRCVCLCVRMKSSLTCQVVQQDEKLWLSPDVTVTAPDVDGTTKPNKATKGSPKSNLADYLNKTAAYKGGFQLRVKSTQKIKGGLKHNIICQRGRKAAASGTGTKYETNTKLSQEGEECGFKFPVYYDNGARLFFVKKHSSCVFTHAGHPATHATHMKLGADSIPDHIRKIADEMLGKNCPTSVVQLLLSVLNGTTVTRDAMNRMRRAVLISKHGNVKDESTADTLIRMLEEKEGTTYCYMTGSYDEALDKVRVRKGLFMI